MNSKLFHSDIYGELTLVQVEEKIAEFMARDVDKHYRVIIGSDSQVKNAGSITDFITAIIVHKIGSGGIYFWKRMEDTKKRVLKQRILEEATFSLATAHELMGICKANGISKFDFEIHVDIGTIGPTRELVSEVVSMIRGSGFTVRTKPYSYGASTVADRHT